jgi:translation elongation factor EF-Tu-like GTPase
VSPILRFLDDVQEPESEPLVPLEILTLLRELELRGDSVDIIKGLKLRTYIV